MNVLWFDSIVEVGPGGEVAYLVDPRFRHHDAALALVRELRQFLEEAASVA